MPHSIDEKIGEDEAIDPTAAELMEIQELSQQEDVAERIRDSISPTIFWNGMGKKSSCSTTIWRR